MILCDAHVHVVGDLERYPMLPQRSYTAPAASLDELQRVAAPERIARFVIVQPSFYGTDNTLLLETVAALGPDGVGVGVLDPARTSDAEAVRFAAAGIRGLRINLYSTHGAAPATDLGERFTALGSIARRMNGHVQVIADLPMLMEAADLLARSPVTVVLDHYGLPGGAAPDSEVGQRLLGLFGLPHVWVKLSAPYRSTGDVLGVEPDPAWLRALLGVAPDRCVWGSDWPHTPAHADQPGEARPAPYRPIDYGALVTAFRDAVGDAGTVEQVMGDNPAKLYGF